MNSTEKLSEWLVPEAPSLPEGAWQWQHAPFNIFVGKEPTTRPQEQILRELQARLADATIGCRFVSKPNQETTLGAFTPMVMTFTQDLEAKITPDEVWKKLPEPRGMPFMVNTVRQLPPDLDFDMARQQLVYKACTNGVIFEEGLQRALWVSMQGNWIIIEGTSEQIFDNISLRILAHYGMSILNHRIEANYSLLPWQKFVETSRGTFQAMSRSAFALGEAKVIKDKVELTKYDPEQGRAIELALNRVSGFGESMASTLVYDEKTNATFTLVTKTGGGKTTIKPKPQKRQLIPVCAITQDGFVVANFQGMPRGKWLNPSVETTENGLVYLASAAAQADQAHDFDSFLDLVKENFQQQGQVPFSPSQWGHVGAAHIQHFHAHPDPEVCDGAKIELVYPDQRRFPNLDFPCGSLWSAYQLLSALFNSETFSQRSDSQRPLNGKVIVALLPGHGSMAVCGPEISREELTQTITNEMGLFEENRSLRLNRV